MYRLIGVVVFVCSLMVLGGCGPKKSLSGTVPVEGIVTLDGVPLEAASITLRPNSQETTARSAGGTSDAQGKFSITTLDYNDGAFPGDYTVMVNKTEIVGKAPTAEELAAAAANEDGPGIVVKTRNVVPEKYTGANSDISVSVPPKGIKDIKIELRSK